MELKEIESCLFTDLPIYNVQISKTEFRYNISINKVEYLIVLPADVLTDLKLAIIVTFKHIFAGFLYNNKWIEDENALITLGTLIKLISEREYPKTAEQKAENLFLYFVNYRRYDGEPFQFGREFYNDNKWKLFYFKTAEESTFYFKVLQEQGLIKANFHKIYDDSFEQISNLEITYKGLKESIKLQQEGELSKKCFIAMSFNPEMKEIRTAIKEAVTETGHEPILIDEKDIDSDKTINDAIIANLKMCKFCIADFTGHSKGVYFESGFALGQNKKVIYTCQEDSFKDAHFDIKPLQHIIYKETAQLKKDLINKINAWVK